MAQNEDNKEEKAESVENVENTGRAGKMNEQRLQTELEKRSVLRLSNEESNRITKECILTALVMLMQEKPFEKITITELVKRSGVSRMAFYRNFSSKQDVLTEIADQICRDCGALLAEYAKDDTPHHFYEQFFAVFEREKTNLDLLRNAGLKVYDLLDVSKLVLMKYMPDNLSTRYSRVSWWSALEGIVLTWYECGMKETIDAMAQICCEVLPPFPLHGDS